jgi:hypothetical protein
VVTITYPLAWDKLSYHTRLDGYRVDLAEEQSG